MKIERLLLRANESEATALALRFLTPLFGTKIDDFRIVFEEGIVRTDALVRLPLAGVLSVSALWRPSVTAEGEIRFGLEGVRTAGFSGQWVRSLLLEGLAKAVARQKGVRVEGASLVLEPVLWRVYMTPPLEMKIQSLTVGGGVLTVGV